MPRKSTEELVRRNIRRLISYGKTHLELEGYDSIFVENELLNMFSASEPYTEDIGDFEIIFDRGRRGQNIDRIPRLSFFCCLINISERCIFGSGVFAAAVVVIDINICGMQCRSGKNAY